MATAKSFSFDDPPNMRGSRRPADYDLDEAATRKGGVPDFRLVSMVWWLEHDDNLLAYFFIHGSLYILPGLEKGINKVFGVRVLRRCCDGTKPASWTQNACILCERSCRNQMRVKLVPKLVPLFACWFLGCTIPVAPHVCMSQMVPTACTMTRN